MARPPVRKRSAAGTRSAAAAHRSVRGKASIGRQGSANGKLWAASRRSPHHQAVRRPPAVIRLRAARRGEAGWLLERHAVVYGQEFGYLPVFDAYVAAGLAPYLEGFDPALDRLWVAEDGGRRVGCIAIQHDPTRAGWAKLRWFLVEREARGTGLGARLMGAALRFAAGAGYEGVQLWTVDDLASARRLYERSGFTLAWQERDPCAWAPWGHEQRWELRLPPDSALKRAKGAGPRSSRRRRAR